MHSGTITSHSLNIKGINPPTKLYHKTSISIKTQSVYALIANYHSGIGKTVA